MQKKPRVLLLVGGAHYHDQPEHREALSRILDSRFDLRMSGYAARTLTAENLEGYDVVADYTSWWEPRREEYLALLQAVMGGKGFACLHPATGTFMNSSAYHDMVGASFVYHDPNKVFKVQFGEREHFGTGELLLEEHPITEGMEDFEVQDELFVVQGDMTRWHILARAEGHPVVWTKRYGAGRVFCTALGHDYRSLDHPSVQTLYVRGIEWAAGLL
jgi:type 1 glutamine amidotransferase